MPAFLLFSRHSPENCPIFNERTRKVDMEFFSKIEELTKKHGVKMIGNWSVHSEHLCITVLEAPSLDAVQKLGREPAMMALTAFETSEVKVASNMEESMKMLQQIK